MYNESLRPVSIPTESVATVVPRRGESVLSFAQRINDEVARRKATVLMLMVYGAVGASGELERGLKRGSGGIDFPLMWIEGASCTGEKIAGAQLFLIDGSVGVRRIVIEGQVIGSVFQDEGARHCLLAGLTPSAVSLSRAVQCEQFFKSAEQALRVAGFSYGDIARTWFYNDEILAWYDDFNRVRTAFYAKQKFRSGSLPASTAVRGRNPRGAALTFAAWAVVPVAKGATVQEVASPLQCPAPAYGSSFSRATEIVSGGEKRLLVSGTASIEPGGKTVWQGDVTKQIALTMDVVEAILRPRGMGFDHVTRATAYFKRPSDEQVFQNWLTVHGLGAMPVVPVHCDICRDDLLFEIELDACVTA